MREEFILGFIPQRMQQLKASKYYLRHRDFGIAAGGMLTISAYNEIYFLIDSPENIRIESKYGVYDSTGSFAIENTYQHRGQIIITNYSDSVQRAQFIQVIII